MWWWLDIMGPDDDDEDEEASMLKNSNDRLRCLPLPLAAQSKLLRRPIDTGIFNEPALL
tara:strand:+ start:662 stop:838 length:177 start_codon:yes stop_codon:yes gene_type:complete